MGAPVALGVIAVATGSRPARATAARALVVFALVAAMMAGETPPGGGHRGDGGRILAIEVSGLVFGANYGVLFGVPLFVFVGLVIGRNRGAYRIQAEQAAMLLAQRERLETEQRRADLLDERARIAREIHDVLAHSLGALGIQIQAARAVLSGRGHRPGGRDPRPLPSGWPPRAWRRPAGPSTPCAPTPCR